MLSGSNPYFGWADLSGAGYQAMAEQLRAYLKNFITSGDPNGKKLLSGSTRWQRWTPDSPALLVLDADADHAITRCAAQTETKEPLLAAMEADSTLSRPETGRDQKTCSRADSSIEYCGISLFLQTKNTVQPNGVFSFTGNTPGPPGCMVDAVPQLVQCIKLLLGLR